MQIRQEFLFAQKLDMTAGLPTTAQILKQPANFTSRLHTRGRNRIQIRSSASIDSYHVGPNGNEAGGFYSAVRKMPLTPSDQHGTPIYGHD